MVRNSLDQVPWSRPLWHIHLRARVYLTDLVKYSRSEMILALIAAAALNQEREDKHRRGVKMHRMQIHLSEYPNVDKVQYANHVSQPTTDSKNRGTNSLGGENETLEEDRI